MKQFLTILTAAFILASCSNSKKDGDATLTDLKTKLEKAKKNQSDNDASIKQMEDQLLKLDTNALAATKIKLVSTVNVNSQKFEHFIDLMGKVDAENITYISPRGMGGQVKAIYVKQGQMVNKGQLVLKLDDAIAQQSIVAANKGLEGIKTQLGFAKNIYQRQKNLWDQGIGTEVQLISAKTNVEGLQNQLTAAQENVKTAQEQLKTFNVYSNVSGIADQVNIHIGETFTGMGVAGPQIKIVNNSNLKVVTNVPENYVTKVHNSTPVTVNIPDANTSNISTSISLISQSVDPTMRGFSAEAKIPYNPSLKPNQTAIMKIKDYSNNNAIVIPINMVQTDETGKYVYIMIKSSNGKTTAHKVPVILGEIYGDNAEIKNGLNGGEQLISEGYQSLYEGQAISTKIITN